ncbi:MAG: xylulokinase [Armatimonadetes bacterium]|nr:xylulokinase [Armatimonadota bacterium]
MPYYLGLDIGTSGAKALLISAEGAPVASDTQEYPLSTPRPLWAEQDPADWWEGTVRATRNILEKSGIRAEEVAGVGLSGQMHGSVFLDGENNVLRPALLWCDQRTQAQCDWITAQVGRENLVKYISNPVLTGFTAPKIVWMREHEPDTYAKVAKVLLPKDYIRYKLTGVHATEVSDASGTALFDVAHRTWSQEVLDAAQIPRAWMPECAESVEITGRISAEAARATGLAAGTPVAGGGGDQAAGAVGSGIVETGIVSNIIGTSGVVFAYADQPATDPDLRVHTFCHAVPGKWHLMGVVLSAGGSLRWLRDTFFAGQPYDEFVPEAADVPPGAEGLIFLPYLTGERTPYPDANARGTFFGMTLRHTRAHFTRAVLEGVAFALNDTFQIFDALGIPMTEARTSGGGAKSPLWTQINADVTAREHVTLTVDEGPALGAALLAAVGTGAYPSVADACRAAIQPVARVAPHPDAHRAYGRYHAIYRALYPALRAQFAAVSEAAVLPQK